MQGFAVVECATETSSRSLLDLLPQLTVDADAETPRRFLVHHAADTTLSAFSILSHAITGLGEVVVRVVSLIAVSLALKKRQINAGESTRASEQEKTSHSSPMSCWRLRFGGEEFCYIRCLFLSLRCERRTLHYMFHTPEPCFILLSAVG